jgi:hypothetical protein
VHVLGGEKHGEADAADEGDDHVAVAAPLGAVGDPAYDDGHGGSDGVGRDGQELGVGALVAHAEQDGGQEERKAVQWAQAAHVADGVAPGLPVGQSGVDVAAVDLANGGLCLAVCAETTHGAQLLVVGQEAGSFGEIENHPPANHADTNGHETLDDEDPSGRISGLAICKRERTHLHPS